MAFAEVAHDRLAALRPMFDEFPGLHGAIDSALEGVNGRVTVGHPEDPGVCHISFHDFHLLAGDPESALAAEAVKRVPPGHHIACPESWYPLVNKLRLARPYDRFAYRAPNAWDREQLTALRNGMPGGMRLERVSEKSLEPFVDLASSFIENFSSADEFLYRGIGFGVIEEAANGGPRFIAGCSSYTISQRSVEFEIQTHPDYQRRGLALVTGSALILHCIERGLEPCWDAAHEGSALLAERLGFVGRRRYTAFSVG